jgi:predicted nucleic acid-binding protein
LFRNLMTEYNIAGPKVTDAALAIEHGATLASTDQDFRRFPEVRWVNPLESQAS